MSDCSSYSSNYLSEFKEYYKSLVFTLDVPAGFSNIAQKPVKRSSFFIALTPFINIGLTAIPSNIPTIISSNMSEDTRSVTKLDCKCPNYYIQDKDYTLQL